MHARIRQRRQAVGFNVAFGNAADNLVALRGNLVLLENKLTELQRFVTDDRLPGLVAAAKSCRAIIDLSADNAELAAVLSLRSRTSGQPWRRWLYTPCR